MRAIFQIAVLLFSLAFAPQGNVIRIPGPGGAGIAAGTAPTFGNAEGCSTGTASCISCCISITPSKSLFVVIASSSNGTESVFDNVSGGANVDTLTCGTAHTFNADRTNVCYILTPTVNSANGGIHCASTSSTDWISCTAFTVTCAAACVIEQGPSYNNTAHTGSAGSLNAGAVTTAFQLNEMIVGGFTTDGTTNSGAGTYTVGSGYTIPSGGQQGPFTNESSVIEYQNVSALGTYTPAITENTIADTVGVTLALR